MILVKKTGQGLKLTLANSVCELELSMSPNKGKEIASGLTSLLLEKNLTSKTL